MASADIQSARYEQPTDAYGHNVVPGGEYEALRIGLTDGSSVVVSLRGTGSVFEDTAPRLIDIDQDGTQEVLSVVSYFDRGAAIRVWDLADDNSVFIRAEGVPIGQRFRWLAIIGAADFDQDGEIEIAYIDRPHLAKVLRIVGLDGDQLVEEASARGFTNHRIGEPDIAGGLRNCGAGPEMIVASGDWSELQSVTWQEGPAFAVRTLGRDTSHAAFARAREC